MLNIFWIQIFSHLYMLHIHTSSLRFVTWCVYGVTDTDGLILMRSQLLSVGQKKCWHACPRHQPAFYLMERELVKGFNNLIFFNVCLFLRETYSLWAGEGHRERETQNPKQAPGSELVSTEPDTGLELTDREIMTWAEVGRLTDWATQAPQSSVFNSITKIPGIKFSNGNYGSEVF